MSSTIKKGYLYKLPQRGIVKKWNKRWFILHGTNHEGVVRIEYFDSEEYAQSDHNRRTIPLRDSSKVEQTMGNKVHPYIFQFNSQIGHHVLAADSQLDMEQWIEAIKDTVREDRSHMRQKKTQSMVVKRSGDEYPTASVGKGYSSKLDSGVYRVTLEQNETTQNMNLQGSYNLEIDPLHLALNNPVTGVVIAKWHYKNLKSYGKKSGKFHFEVGKASMTGPGQFMCVTTCSKEIFGIVSHNIKNLRAQLENSEASKQQSVQQPSQAVQVRATKTSFQRPHSRHSADVADKGVSGSYRVSKDLEGLVPESDPAQLYSVVKKKPTARANILNEADIENHYSLAHDDRNLKQEHFDTQVEDPSQLYSKVIKNPKKKTGTTKGPPLKPPPYAHPSKMKHTNTSDRDVLYATPFDSDQVASNGQSYQGIRDSRDSAIVNIDGNIFESIEEESTHATSSPLSSGVHNPLDDTDALIDFGQLNENVLKNLDILDAQGQASNDDPWVVAREETNKPASSAPRSGQLTQQQFEQIWDNIQTTTKF